ncbi:hypothetical protein NDU88_003709 [Pleurodeles waltl]|uniref:Uncharacterized protein n=1 Tax=Pleurodeles waltl TaxID=8319 RepID=A0AAV7SGQ3_PLEWA|nr:hypothetical protein NDU88_003709 [Pleurodeles waltl]
MFTVAVGGRRPRRNPALVNIGPYGSQEPMTMYAGGDGTHRHGRDRHFLAPAFSTEELEKLVDGVLPQYTLLYGPPEKQVSAHQKKDIWRAIAKGSPDPGGLPQTEHPLPVKMGRHSPLEHEDGGGPAGDGLPTWEGCPSHHDPPDVQDPGGGVPGVGWALEGITADTRE